MLDLSRKENCKNRTNEQTKKSLNIDIQRGEAMRVPWE